MECYELETLKGPSLC